jgi:hypothetical protein
MAETSTQANPKVTKVGLKRKEQEPEQTGGVLENIGGEKKVKAQCQAPFFILTDDHMDRIGYLIHDSTE